MKRFLMGLILGILVTVFVGSFWLKQKAIQERQPNKITEALESSRDFKNESEVEHKEREEILTQDALEFSEGNTPIQGYKSENNQYVAVDEEGKELYRLVIDSVETMEERNPYDEREPAQVVLINYTYTNISLETALYLDRIQFSVLDQTATIGDLYPNPIQKRPQSISAGVTCHAQMVFALENESQSIQINYYENNSENPTVTFGAVID